MSKFHIYGYWFDSQLNWIITIIIIKVNIARARRTSGWADHFLIYKKRVERKRNLLIFMQRSNSSALSMSLADFFYLFFSQKGSFADASPTHRPMTRSAGIFSSLINVPSEKFMTIKIEFAHLDEIYYIIF